MAVQQGHEKVVAALLHNDSRVNNSPVTFSFKFLFYKVVFQNFFCGLNVSYDFFRLGLVKKAIPQASSCWILSFLYEFFYISV